MAEAPNAECVGWHVCKVGSRFAALDPIAQGLERRYGSLDADVARGLALRMDHGSQYLSDHFLKQIRYWGIHPSFGFVEEPETNGVAERWNRTLKEQAIHGRIFQNLAAVRAAVADFVVRYNQTWRLEKLGYHTPIEAREEYELRQAASHKCVSSEPGAVHHSFTVTNGKVTRARRNNGRNDSWEITVTPWGNEALTVTLPGNRDCGTTAAICTKEDHPVQLSNSPSATVAGPPGVSTVPVTASFGNMPAEHDGSTFTFDLSFSENVAAGYARIRDHAFSVNGANIKKAQRKTQGSNQNWTVTVDPIDNGGVSITLPETTNSTTRAPSARMTDAS